MSDTLPSPQTDKRAQDSTGDSSSVGPASRDGEPSGQIEREIKLRATGGLDEVRAALLEQGAHEVDAEHFESNTLFDRNGELRGQHRVLRLRTAGERVILTYKGPPHFEGDVKVRDEIDLDLSDARGMTLLLDALGYEPTMRYEKRRETWRLDATLVSLDQTPIGTYVELEGGDIEQVRHRLGLDGADVERRSYPGLWSDHRRSSPTESESMVFEPDRDGYGGDLE